LSNFRFFFEKAKNKLIFISVSILALNAFYVISTLGVGHPAPDEIEIISSIKLFLEGGSWWEDEWFLQHFEHRIIIPNLIFFFSALLDQGNTIHIMYLGWFFVVISIIPLYSLLKKINQNYTWLIIPITALMFNLGQTTCFTWGICSIVWHLTSLLIISTIFFIDRIDKTRISLIFAIVCAIAVSFTMFQGLLIWIVGIFGLLFVNTKKKANLVIWIVSGIITISLFFTNYDFHVIDEMQTNSDGLQLTNLFTSEGISYILLFLSNGLLVQIPQTLYFQYFIGIGLIFTIIFTPIYLRLKKFEIRPLIPWFQFGLYSLFGALVLVIGRSEVVSANASRYIAWSVFGHIAALVLGMILLLYLYKKLKNRYKKFSFKILLSILFLLLILGVSTSSYSGLKIANDLYQKNLLTFDCLRDPNFDLKCHSAYYYEDAYNNIRDLRDLKLGVFATQFIPPNDPLMDNSNWKNMELNPNGFGKIEYINSKFNTDRFQELQTQTFVDVNSSPIDIGGWGIFAEKNKDVDSAYVFVNNQVHSSAYYGYQSPHNVEILGEQTDPSFYSGFGGVIILENLSSGCHDVSIRITYENEYFEIFSNSQICINS